MHGHHTGALRVVVRQLADQCDVDVALALPAAMAADKLKEITRAGPGASSHAGEFETSLMLHRRPDLVDMSAATDADRLTLDTEFSSSEVFWSTWRRQRTTTGAYGAPTQASAETGQVLFDTMVERLAEFAHTYYDHTSTPEPAPLGDGPGHCGVISPAAQATHHQRWRCPPLAPVFSGWHLTGCDETIS